MKDPTEDGFYAILKTVTGHPDARRDEVIDPGTKGLRAANNLAAALDEALTEQERKRGVRYYTASSPVRRDSARGVH